MSEKSTIGQLEDNHKTESIVLANSRAEVSKATADENLKIAGRFAQTLLKKLPARRLEETAKGLLAVEKTVISSFLKAAEDAMENLKLYVMFLAPKGIS